MERVGVLREDFPQSTEAGRLISMVGGLSKDFPLWTEAGR